MPAFAASGAGICAEPWGRWPACLPDQAEALAQGVWRSLQRNSTGLRLRLRMTPADFTLVGELNSHRLDPGGVRPGPALRPHPGRGDAAQPDPVVPAPACLRRGQGLSLIHQCADEVRWLNHGPEGKELRFTKYRTGVLPPGAASPAAAAGPPHQAAALTAGPGLHHPPAAPGGRHPGGPADVPGLWLFLFQ